MTDANYRMFLTEAQALIDQKQFLQASLELFAAAELMDSHPERSSVLFWAEQCRAKAKTMRFRSLAYLAMWATPEPPVDLAGREMQGRA
jgi:hypothetical protein